MSARKEVEKYIKKIKQNRVRELNKKKTPLENVTSGVKYLELLNEGKFKTHDIRIKITYQNDSNYSCE